MTAKSIHQNFKPAGSEEGTGEGLAVTLGAGIQLYDMYEWLGEHGIMIVGGSSHGVGVAGGYIQGGGHSLLAAIRGMASDNALEFSVVTADVSTIPVPRKPNATLNSNYRAIMSLQTPIRTLTSSGLFAEEAEELGESLPRSRCEPLMMYHSSVSP